MDEQTKTLAGSIEHLGIVTFMDLKYSYHGTTFIGGFNKLAEMIEAGKNNQEIGNHFYRVRQTVRDWREAYETWKEAGGTIQ